MIDRELQRTKTYSGIVGINTQDFALQEGMGAIVDRTKEHLGTSDRAIIAMRQMLLEGTRDVEAGRAPKGTEPKSYRNVAPTMISFRTARIGKRASAMRSLRSGNSLA